MIEILYIWKTQITFWPWKYMGITSIELVAKKKRSSTVVDDTKDNLLVLLVCWLDWVCPVNMKSVHFTFSGHWYPQDTNLGTDNF